MLVVTLLVAVQLGDVDASEGWKSYETRDGRRSAAATWTA